MSDDTRRIADMLHGARKFQAEMDALAPKPITPRIRINEVDARYLYRLLTADRLAALAERRWMIEAGFDPLTFQQWTGRAQRIRREIEHLARLMEWNLDEPLGQDSQAAGSGLPSQPS